MRLEDHPCVSEKVYLEGNKDAVNREIDLIKDRLKRLKEMLR